MEGCILAAGLGLRDRKGKGNALALAGAQCDVGGLVEESHSIGAVDSLSLAGWAERLDGA